MSDFEQRKKDHIRLALSEQSQNLMVNQFSKIQLIHQALPEINLGDVQLTTELLGHSFSSPHFISSMTAGHADSLTINANLALAAQEKNWLMAVGSQRRELSDPAAILEWNEIRKRAPKTHFVSNIGILELIQNPVENILKITENLQAIGIFVHLNPLQEAFQMHAQADFSQGLKAIEVLVKKSKIPVLVKEVGSGISAKVIKKLIDIGVHAVDVAGGGGTHWGWIEAQRHPEHSVERMALEAFNDWGISTVQCLMQVQEFILFHPIWASGGIRHGVDSAKCLALGARAVGLAQPLMKAAVESESAIVKAMDVFDYQLKVAMFCSGISRPADFLHQKVWQ